MPAPDEDILLHESSFAKQSHDGGLVASITCLENESIQWFKISSGPYVNVRICYSTYMTCEQHCIAQNKKYHCTSGSTGCSFPYALGIF